MAKKQLLNYKFVPGPITPAYNQYPYAVNLLNANRTFIVEEMHAYITAQVAANSGNAGSPYYNYNYNATKNSKCKRDMGYVLDALIYDLVYGGNSMTWQIASRFYTSNTLQLINPLIEADVKTYISGIVTNKILQNISFTAYTVAETQTILDNDSELGAITKVSTLFQNILDVIQIGQSSLPSLIVPNSQNGSLVPNTVALLNANKRFIQEETIAYIQFNVTSNIEPFVYYTYNSEKCKRDVSYIIEGYITDLMHGGNRQTVHNVSKYFENGVPQVDGDRTPEVAAHTFIKNLITSYVLLNVAYSAKQSIVPQVTINSLEAETYGITAVSALCEITTDVITNGLSVLPSIISNRGYIKFPGFYKLKDILLITNATRNTILYNFADPSASGDLTYSEFYDSDFPGALYGQEKITKLTLDADTTDMMVTDQIQIFVEGKEQIVKLNPAGTDAMERQKVGIPQSMLDADFEYGLQPTKWQAIGMMRNYPAVYEIPGSDIAVTSVVTDASAGTANTGSSMITVTTLNSHGLVAGSVITIKALANSITGFARAEGSFIVSSAPSPTTFTYYAKSKVGTSNGQQLSSTYTQLRKAGYYTGAGVSNPQFNVYSTGSSGTVTTSLITVLGSNFIGFTGTIPPVGSPISGTGITAGTQITAVTGPGGTAATTTLATNALIGDTVITVSSTSGITPGLVFDRGDGKAVLVTQVSGNDVSLSGVLTSNITGNSQTYTSVSQSSTSGGGSGATFNVSRTGASYSVSVIGGGQLYATSDTVLILGTSLGGTTSNNATITITSASPKYTVGTLNTGSLAGGSGYVDGTNISTTGGTGSGLTLDIITDGFGVIQSVTINQNGSGYTDGDLIHIAGGNNDATINVATTNLGGVIQTASITGTPINVPTKTFVSAFTINSVTTSEIASGDTSISYSAIATIEVTFPSPHGFVPGNTITTSITSNGTNAQLAAGAFYVEQAPTSTSIRYTARAPGAIANTLTGTLYARPDSYFVHRPFDGGVQLGTGGPAHGAQAIRMSKKYIRYQSGKGVMYNTGALFAPSYDIRSISAAGTTVGSVITLVTDDTDHGCQVGAQIVVSGVQTSGYNGIYTVQGITDERTLTILAQQVLGSTSAILNSPCVMSIRQWHGSTVRSGIFDDQNGMFWQYDGIRLAVVRRSSTFQIAGTISVATNSNAVTGSNTRFTQQLSAGDRIVIRGMSHVVTQVLSDTNMSIAPDFRGVYSVSNVKICKTVDLVVSQENFNLDPINGSGPSGYNFDVTKMQMIGIQHTWYGAGFIDFMLRGPEGNYIWCHRFRNSNVNTEAYMRTGNQPVRYEVVNEGARTTLTSNITDVQINIPITDGYWFPNSGTILIDNELITYTGNTGSLLTNCARGSSLTQFAGGAQRTFAGGTASSHTSGTGVILVSNTITPIISHWGSAFMIDGQFDSDRGYIFNYASTGVSVSVDKQTAFLIRLAPSVSNAQTGDLGEKELLNRAQMLLSNISIVSDSVSGGGGIVIEGVLNPSNYPDDPTKISWNGLSSQAAGGQPSFAQIAPGGSVTWGGNATTATATVQGAFTTTLTAKSFAPVTNSLTAVSFNAVTRPVTAASFAPATSATYTSALSTGRTDFLMLQSTVDALKTQTPLAVGDALSVGTYITGGQTISSITENYISLGGSSYARIIMSAVANSTSSPATSNGQYNIGITTTSVVAGRYNTAISAARTDFLITQSQYASSTIASTDVLSATTYVTGGQTISGITPNYTYISGTAYARVIMSSAGTNTSTAGSGNNITVTSTSAATATYGSAISTTRSDFLITDASYSSSGIAVGDALSLATYITGSQTISAITPSYINISGTNYTRIVMSAVANATSTSGAGQDQTVTNTAAGTASSYAKTSYLYFDSTTWLASGANVGTRVASDQTAFPAGTSVNGVTTRTFGATTVYRVTFTQSANTTINASGTLKFQFGALYALPGEQVFSFISNPGNSDNLSLESLKELTATAIGGRGAFPNGPDVLAINVYKVSGSPTTANLILRWSEAQA